jgi:hypothetical protein
VSRWKRLNVSVTAVTVSPHVTAAARNAARERVSALPSLEVAA